MTPATGNNAKRVPVLWFGTGSMTENLLPAVDHSKVQILAFIDEREEMRGRYIYGLPMIDLSAIHSFEYEYITVKDFWRMLPKD